MANMITSVFRLCTYAVPILALQIFLAAPSQCHSVLDVFPQEELDGPQTKLGEIDTAGFLAVVAAIPEIERQGLKASQYRTINVWRAGASFHVQFSQRELASMDTGSEGTPRPITVRIRAADYKVLGSYIWP